MGMLNKDTFVCIDCETTGLDPKNDRIIEIAVAKFTFSEILESYQSLIDPQCPIPNETTEIHHITSNMVSGQPKIEEILPILLEAIGTTTIVGHGIGLDIAFITESARKHSIPCNLESIDLIDTLRMARIYGESPTNSLEKLREHFNIEEEGAHRAMNDVIVNIAVFKHLVQNFKTTEQLLERLKKPVLLKTMPLGKYKGRSFGEIPIEYLRWASQANFDQDLLFSVKTELNKRKRGDRFLLNPFSQL